MQKSELDEAKETLRRRDIELERIKKNLENLEKQEKDRREKENKEIMEDKHRYAEYICSWFDFFVQRSHDRCFGQRAKACRGKSQVFGGRTEQSRRSHTAPRRNHRQYAEVSYSDFQNAIDYFRSQKEFIDETMKRHRDELKERDDMRQREINSMTEEDKERRRKEQTERDRLNKEIEEARESLRNSKSEEVALRIKVEEKGTYLSYVSI